MAKKSSSKVYIPERGDICWLNFDPQAGHEQAKRRPALVISDTLFNNLGLAMVCPISSTAPRHGFHIPVPKPLQTSGTVLAEQLKSVDFLARDAVYIERAPVGLVQYVRGILARII